MATAVVGHHALDFHSMDSESGDRSTHERRSGLCRFVRQDLGVHVPGIIIDGVMDEGVVPDPASISAAAQPSTMMHRARR